MAFTQIDWLLLVKNLASRGIGVTQAATLAQVPANHIADLLHENTLEPPFSVGHALLDLHLDFCPNQHDQLLQEDDHEHVRRPRKNHPKASADING